MKISTYNTPGGDIYRIIEQGSDELMCTVEDHGVTRVQGIVFHDIDLIIVGNIQVNEGKGSKGRVMRGRLQDNGERVWTTIAETAEYGNMMSAFDHAFNLGLFYNDPDFPQMPGDLVVTPPVQNIGPDANYFMNFDTGEVSKGDEAGRTVGTFTAHRSPPGLFFDRDSLLTDEFRGDAFVLSYTAHNTALTRPFYGDKPMMSEDLMHLKLFYSEIHENYIVQSTRIVENFDGPTDALMIGNEVYVINNKGSRPSHIWKITLPPEKKESGRNP